MRPTCPFCARKHIAQAIILLSESQQGYPAHFYLALGHLAEASDELVAEQPDRANIVRKVRKDLEEAPTNTIVMRMCTEVLMEFFKEEPPGGQPTQPLHLVVGSEPGKLADGRSLAQAVREFTERGEPDPIPAGKGAPCKPCEAKIRREEAFAHVDMMGRERRLVILTTLANFDASYSLSTCVLEQAHAALMVGFRVNIIMMDHTNPADLPYLPPEITIERLMPTVSWAEDEINDEQVALITHALMRPLERYAPCSVITHDLLFQSWFTSAAKALHLLPAIEGVQFYHVAHSSVSVRPERKEIAKYRATLPTGHKLMTINFADRKLMLEYYQAGSADVVTVLNGRDIRAWQRMPERAALLVSQFGLHLRDVVQVYPISATRMEAKGIKKLIALFGALKQQDQQVCLVVVAAHANGSVGQAAIKEARVFGTDMGLSPDELVFVSDIIPDCSAVGLAQDDVRSLFQVANLFAFPTVSEAGSLVLMEAALSDCLLVLNSSLPCFRDYVPAESALWVPWGSIKEVGAPIDTVMLAGRIIEKMRGDMRMQAKRHMLRNHALEQVGERLLAALGR